MPVTSLTANVADFLLEGKDAAQVALLTLNRSHSYGELEQASLRVALHLIGEGAVAGDRALLVSNNSFFWVAAYLGILRAGMVCVPVSPTVPEGDLYWILQNTEAQWAFLQRSFLRENGNAFDEIAVIVDGDQSSHNAQPMAAL